MKLVVGLGNPGRKYRDTRHNIGFMCIDAYAKENNIKLKKDNKFSGEIAKEGNLVLLKPHTFMNLSGESIQKAITYYNVDIEDVLIIFDDLALPVGKLRLREQGGSGGHNGIKSVIQHLKTENFKRVRIGIDQNDLIETKNYVLSKFAKSDQKTIEQSVKTIINIIDDFSKNKEFSNIMNLYN